MQELALDVDIVGGRKAKNRREHQISECNINQYSAGGRAIVAEAKLYFIRRALRHSL